MARAIQFRRRPLRLLARNGRTLGTVGPGQTINVHDLQNQANWPTGPQPDPGGGGVNVDPNSQQGQQIEAAWQASVDQTGPLIFRPGFEDTHPFDLALGTGASTTPAAASVTPGAAASAPSSTGFSTGTRIAIVAAAALGLSLLLD